jgi:hypothetical protein
MLPAEYCLGRSMMEEWISPTPIFVLVQTCWFNSEVVKIVLLSYETSLFFGYRRYISEREANNTTLAIVQPGLKSKIW